MKISLTNQNFIWNPDLPAEDLNNLHCIEVPDEEGEKLFRRKLGYVWHYYPDLNEFKMEPIQSIEKIRERREYNCFNLIDNKSFLWWQKLTQEQLVELDTWYSAWLKAPETLVEPEKPEWLN